MIWAQNRLQINTASRQPECEDRPSEDGVFLPRLPYERRSEAYRRNVAAVAVGAAGGQGVLAHEFVRAARLAHGYDQHNSNPIPIYSGDDDTIDEDDVI